MINVKVNFKSSILRQEGDRMYYSMKDVTLKTGLPAYVLRYYEKEGLLPSITRTKSGIRKFTDKDLELLGLICCLKKTGMSIKQIKDFVELSMQGDNTLKERCELLREHKENVEIRIKEMSDHLDKVSHKLEYFTSQYDRFSNGDGPYK